MKINYQPTFNRVLVKTPQFSEKTKSGIIKDKSIIEAEQSKPKRLEILAVGPEVKYVKVGDLVDIDVRIAQHTTIDIYIGETLYSLLMENACVGIYTPTEEEKLQALTPVMFDTTTVVN